MLEAPCSKINVNLAGYGFVDDTDVLQTCLSNGGYWGISIKLQACVDLLGKCTEISVGYLVPTKSS